MGKQLRPDDPMYDTEDPLPYIVKSRNDEHGVTFGPFNDVPQAKDFIRRLRASVSAAEGRRSRERRTWSCQPG